MRLTKACNRTATPITCSKQVMGLNLPGGPFETKQNVQVRSPRSGVKLLCLLEIQ